MNPGRTYRYPLTFSNVIRHAATVMEQARLSGRACSIEDMTKDYDHSPIADLSRVKHHHGLATNEAAIRFLFEQAIESLDGRVEQVDGGYRLTKPLTDIRYPKDAGSPGTRIIPVDLSKPVLGDPFHPMSGRFSDNIRRTVGNLDALRESMRALGWLRERPAIKDERGVVIAGHRRLMVAKELGIEVREGIEIVTRHFGLGDLSDLDRARVAFYDNEAAKPLTAEERRWFVEHLYVGEKLTQAEIAERLGISQATVTRDLRVIHVNNRDPSRGGRPRKPRNGLDPAHPLSHTTEQQARATVMAEEGQTLDAIAVEVGTSEMPVRAWANRERGRRDTVTHVTDSPHGCPAPGCDHGKTDV